MRRQSLLVIGLSLVWLVTTLVVVPGGVTAEPPTPLAGGLRGRGWTEDLSPVLGPTGSADTLVPLAIPAGLADWTRIAFETYRHGNWEIYLARGDLTQPMRLTNHPASDFLPRLNRGATRVAFTSYRDGNSEIYTMNADGSGLTRLTHNNASDNGATWSPDGSRIAFSSKRDGNWEIYVMNADGSGQTRLTQDAPADVMPAWSPDGRRIAWVRFIESDSSLWIMNADGTDPHPLSIRLRFVGDPAWSPDGMRLAFDYDADGDDWTELGIINADGTGLRMVYDMMQYQVDAWMGSWSPDGEWLLFSRVEYVVENNKLYYRNTFIERMPATGGAVERLAPSGYDMVPDWQTIDVWPPTSSVNPLPIQSPATFSVSWAGSDTGQAGLQTYDVQVRDGPDGAWTDWLVRTTATAGWYTGVGGHTYAFRSRARDYAGNMEAWPPGADASTTVEALPPTSAVKPLPPFSRGTLSVKWMGSDPGGSGIKTYDVQYQDTTSGTWTPWLMGTTTTSASFNGTPGHTYRFRSRATDNAQNVESWPSGDGDTATTFYAWQVAGSVHDGRAKSIPGAPVMASPAALTALTTDATGRYLGYFAEGGRHVFSVAQAGYGTPAAMLLDVTGDKTVTHVLPPLDQVVVNGDFEAGEDLSGWKAGGLITPTLTSALRHTGDRAALLGRPIEEYGTIENVNVNHQPRPADQTAVSFITQAITLSNSLHEPTLSLLYQLRGASPNGGSWFDIQVSNGVTTTTLLSTTTSTDDWTHLWFNLSPWAGQTITLTFTVHQTAGFPGAWAYLDEVAVGSWLTPVPEAITPGSVEPWVSTIITVTGENFINGPALRLNDQPLDHVQWLDNRTLQVTLPNSLLPGNYDLWVTNPGGQVGVLANGLRIGRQVHLPVVLRGFEQ